MRQQSRRKPTGRAQRGTSAEPMERRVLLSFTPYVSGNWTATPNYEYLNAATGQVSEAKPLGSATPNGAPLTPATMRAAYGLGTYGNSNVTFGGIQGDGSGQTIAIVDVGSDPTALTDLQAFDAYYNLPDPPSFQQLSQTGSSTNLPAPASGWVGEISLDIQWAHVMAPKANIILFAASDLYAAVRYAASYPGVSVVSMSFTIGGNAPDSSFVTPSGHTGVSFFAGNGDTGSEVPSPAQSVNVVAVGGTKLTLRNGAYGSESAWSAGGGGVSDSEAQPAYQAGLVSQFSTTQRTTPDISMDGDPGSGVAIYDSYDNGTATPWGLVIGGTSLSTPLMAGMVAVVDQGRVAAGLTALDGGSQLLPRLYQLSQANYAGNYHDVTTGNNGHPAGVGYDLASGIGTPVGNKWIYNLAGADNVSGRAFVDNNGNGSYDAGTDTILSGRTLYLDLNNDGVQEPTDPTTTTDANGLYAFNDVIGSITGAVRLVGTTGYQQTIPAALATGYNTSQTFNVVLTSTATTYTATASPTSTTKSTTLGVTINGTAPAGLAYTWSVATAPTSTATATFSANGTAAAQTTVATFTKAGTYTLAVKITDASGHVATTSVVVTVTQVVSGVGVQPPTGLTAGQSEQLVALGYDQFGDLIGPVSAGVSWAVTAGGGAVTAAGVYTTPATGTLATRSATLNGSTATGTVPVVSQPWTSADVGNVPVVGSAYDTGAAYTLTNTSDDIWGTSDDFHFDYQKVTGDFTFTARLASQTSTSSYIKAGLMVRNTLDANSTMAMEADPAPGPLFEWRTTAGASAAQNATSGPTAPQWLRLVRAGNVLTGYSSADGVTWTQTGTQTITMNSAVYVGLALSSHDASRSATATFTNVSLTSAQTLTRIAVVGTPVNLTAGQAQQLVAVAYDQNGVPMANQPTFVWNLTSGGGTLTSAGLYTPPAAGTLATVTVNVGGTAISATGTVAVVASPWTSTDVGTVGTAGTAYDAASGTTTITVASDDIWNQSDDFHFDYQTMTGDGTIVAKLNSQTSASSYIKAGLMIRNALDANAAMAMVNDPSPGPLFEWRTTAGGTATQTATSVSGNAPAEWLKLVRAGNNFTAYYSKNGTTWTAIGTQAIAMNATVYVGLALTSHSASQLATATFTNVTIYNPAIVAPATASPNPVTGTTATLAVNATTPAGDATLSYGWSATTLPAGASAPTFSVNNTNGAKSTVVTFTKAGTYILTATVTDALGQTATSTVLVVVDQTLSAIRVTPTSASLSGGQTAQFAASAVDQFGTAMASQPSVTWSLDSGSVGTVSSAGLYTAPSGGSGSATVRATSGAVSGTATVTVAATTVTNISGTSGNDTIRLVRSGANLLVYVNNATTPAYTLTYSAMTSLTIATGAGTDTVNVDYSGGATPVPSGGLTVQGGGGADTLVLTGTAGSDAVTVDGASATVNGTPTAYSGISAIVLNGNGGADVLTQAAQPGNGATLTFNATTTGGPNASDTLNVAGGTFRFAARAAGAGVAALPLSSLSVSSGAKVALATAASTADRWALDPAALSIASGGTVDLGGNDLVIPSATLATVAI